MENNESDQTRPIPAVKKRAGGKTRGSNPSGDRPRNGGEQPTTAIVGGFSRHFLRFLAKIKDQKTKEHVHLRDTCAPKARY